MTALLARWAAACAVVLLFTGPAAAEPLVWPAAGNVVIVKLVAPSGLAPLPDDALPTMELDGVPEGKTVLRRGVHRPGTELRLMGLCVQTSSSMWAPDLEATVFDRLHDTVRHELERKGAVDRFSPGRPVPVPPRFEAALEADVAVMDRSKPRPLDASQVPKVRVLGRSTLGFVGNNASMLVCGVVCAEPATDAPQCQTVLASTVFEGAFVPPPSPALVGRVVAAFVRSPGYSSALVTGLSLLFLGALIAAWPPSRQRSAGSAPLDEEDFDPSGDDPDAVS